MKGDEEVIQWKRAARKTYGDKIIITIKLYRYVYDGLLLALHRMCGAHYGSEPIPRSVSQLMDLVGVRAFVCADIRTLAVVSAALHCFHISSFRSDCYYLSQSQTISDTF